MCSMFPITLLHENYLDVLADASHASFVSTPDDVCAVVTLAGSALCVGSNIDVFCKGLYWEAEIMLVEPGRFRYRFLHTKGASHGGWVSRQEFPARWRFPIRIESDVWKAHLVADAFY